LTNITHKLQCFNGHETKIDASGFNNFVMHYCTYKLLLTSFEEYTSRL